MQGSDALKSLHTALIDARKGYEEASRKATDAGLLPIFQEAERLHEQSRAAVQTLLIDRGEQTDQSGSFMSTVNKAVVSIRSAITGLDEHSLGAFAKGEETILKRYDEAIEANAGDTAAVEILRKHKDAMIELIAKMRAMTA